MKRKLDVYLLYFSYVVELIFFQQEYLIIMKVPIQYMFQNQVNQSLVI